MMQNRYIAIDFETANAKRVSACSIGVAVIENGHVVETFTSLIKPPPSYDNFAPINVRIHGITCDMVADAPTFDALYPQLRQLAAGVPILGYSKFDRSVLQSLAEYYELPISRTRINGYVDVCSLAQKQFPQLNNHKLATLARYFDLGDFKHHDASDDAAICALVFLALKGCDVSSQKNCSSICRKPLTATHVNNTLARCYGDAPENCVCDERVHVENPSLTEIATAFSTFAALILEDNLVDYKEAIELRCFLSMIPQTCGVEKLASVLDAFLEDSVIDSDESSILIELILNVSAELTGKAITNCSTCGVPVRKELFDTNPRCPWCGTSFKLG